jgi:hypothetical protein
VLATLDPEKKPWFSRGDSLIVPMLNFDITRNYTELTGLGISGSKHRGEISEAIQNIRLRLDERGAVLKSEAMVIVATSASPIPPKSMVCDGPFALIMIHRNAAHPYLAAWIENPELLVPWK